MTIRHFIFGLLVLCLLGGCSQDDEMMTPKAIDSYQTGIFVINQGNEDVASGTVSFYQRDCAQVENNIYLKANTETRLGNKLRAMTIIGERGYVLSEQAKTMTVVNVENFEHLSVVEGFEQAQSLLSVNNNKIYVSEWGADGIRGNIQVVDLASLTVTKTISTNSGPGKMLQVGPAVYAVNSGGFGLDSVLTKIDATTDQIINVIEVGLNPVDLVQDKTGAIWVLCAGVLNNFQNPDAPENKPASLVKIVNDVATLRIPLTAGARNLVINNEKDQLYFVNNNWTYAHPIANTTLSLTPFLAASYNSYAVDPQSGYLVAGNAFDFKRSGEVILFDLADSSPVDTFEVGLVPIAFTFR